MNVIRIQAQSGLYSSNAYLVLGDWKRIEDVNTLIDVGSDPEIVQKIRDLNTGIGKRKVDQVILTHGHSDHTAALGAVKEAFGPKVFAFSPHTGGVDFILKDGDRIRVGDRMCDILHFPVHSDDSIVIHNSREGELFVGDTPILIRGDGGTYDRRFRENLETLCRKNVKSIFFGHGDPLFTGAKQALMSSLHIIRQAHGLADDRPPEAVKTFNRNQAEKKKEVVL